MENDCMKIVFEFHKHVKKWWSKICVHNKTINEPVHNIKKMWLFENDDLYDDFQSMPCKRGNIQITKSEIFHESTVHVNNKIQRIVLFWFVNIKKNHEILNNIELEIWNKFNVYYIAQIVLFFTSFEFFNWFEVIPYKFSFFIHLSLSNPFSKTLIN